MRDAVHDQAARDRFIREFDRNFAVCANAGSGKTTAISSRLAQMALSLGGADLLPKMVVVTFTRKAAAQIRAKARETLWRALTAGTQAPSLAALDHLDRAFFGTIHSFCLRLGRQFGHHFGLHLDPLVLEASDEERLWEEFLEADPMRFSSLSQEELRHFLRFLPLDSVFELARNISPAGAERLRQRSPGPPPALPQEVYAEIMSLTAKGRALQNVQLSQAILRSWVERYGRAEERFLRIPKPAGTSAAVVAGFDCFFAPLRGWLAGAGAALAAELALRYRDYRFGRGIQTYLDQVDGAHGLLQDAGALDAIRGEGYRVLLDEAQDTDAQQFSILVEITRPAGSLLGTWPGGPGAAPPQPGHFCLVGDGQQAIYGSRADLRNFMRYVEAFEKGDGGERLTFDVTFRAPHAVVGFLNAGLPAAFATARTYNCDPASGSLLQVPYVPLSAGPANLTGSVSRLPLDPPEAKLKVASLLEEEVRQIAAFLKQVGPAGVGASCWGEICLLAPRNDWLADARRALDRAGLKTMLHLRRNRNGDNPVFAWTSGLLAILDNPENTYEWVGVLRELFAVSDAELAGLLHAGRSLDWTSPENLPAAVRAAVETLRPFIARVDEEGGRLDLFFQDLVREVRLREKARAADPSGNLEAELLRLQARCETLGRDGAGPRELWQELAGELEEGRPAGQAEEDALNLMTCHSAKGLEWPVVVPIGFWRTVGHRNPPNGFLVIGDPGRETVFYDPGCLPAETAEARGRERLRELTRLFYVALTRARRHLIIPYHRDFSSTKKESFECLLGADVDGPARELLEGLPEAGAVAHGFASPIDPAGQAREPRPDPAAVRWPPDREVLDQAARRSMDLPQRRLPHELARYPDAVRFMAERTDGEPALGGGEDPLDYGMWWHETLEWLPWRESPGSREAYWKAALQRAEGLGLAGRARREAEVLQHSTLYIELLDPRWSLLAELAVFAPAGDDAWIDGVIDLVAEDPGRGELLVLDWKTNRPRRGESGKALLARLAGMYAPQLQAYASCLKAMFPERLLRLGIYATAAGDWIEIPPE